ncbi:hypothetical protein THIOKS1850025 [Thiocapsa sp. KS1]|nr:hypothetical protein THIOKS1850025 [Thiocapsa sp. KS1]
MTLREPVSQNSPDPGAWSKASLMTPEKIDTLTTRYTLCIEIPVSLRTKVRHARFAAHRRHRTNHPSR